MNKSTQKQVLTLTCLSLASGLVAGLLVVGSYNSAEAGIIIPSSSQCDGGQGDALHFDKIIFHTEIAGLLTPQAQPVLAGTMMDIKIVDPEVGVVILADRVAQELNILGWTHLNASPVNGAFIVIDDVEYAVFCENGSIQA